MCERGCVRVSVCARSPVCMCVCLFKEGGFDCGRGGSRPCNYSHLAWRKKITISVITQEGNYGGEAAGRGLYSVYIFLSAQVVLQVDTFGTIINFPKILRVLFQQRLTARVSQHFQRSRLSNNICLVLTRARRRTAHLALYLALG